MRHKLTLSFALVVIVFTTVGATSLKTIPVKPTYGSGAVAPKLALLGAETEVVQGQKYTVTSLTITNWAEYSKEFFTPAPSLPPCGKNTNAARTWLTIHRQDTGEYVYGYCAMTSPADLKQFTYATPAGKSPPMEVFVRLTDRKTKTTFQSNCINAWSGVACGKP